MVFGAQNSAKVMPFFSGFFQFVNAFTLLLGNVIVPWIGYEDTMIFVLTAVNIISLVVILAFNEEKNTFKEVPINPQDETIDAKD
jgi:hypothetical protein